MNSLQLLAGLGLFLFGMSQLEAALKFLAGPKFRQFLRQHTHTPLQGALTGTVATSILQSSSVVTLMVLAFVGAGVLELRNALGIIYGANLGTTFTGWIVATLGFKLNFNELALLLVGIGGSAAALLNANSQRAQLARAIVGIGLLLMGLTLMKDGVEILATKFSIQPFAHLPIIAILAIGFVFTAIIQSSSAAMMIALSALSAGIVELQHAAAFVIGADLGTTSTTMLGGIGGSPDKKRVAVSHFIFNLVTDVIAFLALHPLLLLVAYLGIDDPLFALVAFHSSFNLIGILIFLPFTAQFATFLQKRFHQQRHTVATVLPRTPVQVPEAAISAIETEAGHLLELGLNVIHQGLGAEIPAQTSNSLQSPSNQHADFSSSYLRVKQLEGEILLYIRQLQKQSLNESEAHRIAQLLSAVRDVVSASKAIKDIRDNLVEFEAKSANPLAALIQQLVQEVGQNVFGFWQTNLPTEQKILSLNLQAAHLRAQQLHHEFERQIYRKLEPTSQQELDFPTALNVNHELWQCGKSLFAAITLLYLDEAEP